MSADPKMLTRGYVGKDILLDLFSDTKAGQYFDDVLDIYAPGYRQGDTDTHDVLHAPIYASGTSRYDNFEFQGDTSFFAGPEDANIASPSVLESDTPSDELEIQFYGEDAVLYGLTDASYGSAEVFVDDVSQGTFNFTDAPTTVQIATMEAGEGWDGSSTSDTVNFTEGSASRKITNATPSSTITSKLTLGSPTDMSTVDDDSVLAVDIGIDTASLASRVTFQFSSDAGAFVNFAYQNWSGNLVTGNVMTTHYVRKRDLRDEGTIDWTSVKQLALVLGRNATVGSGTASFDNARWITPTEIMSVTGLDPDTPHTLKVVVTSGTVIVSHLVSTGTKEAAEYSNSATIQLAPTMASMYLMTDDTAWADRAVGCMNYAFDRLQVHGRDESDHLKPRSKIGTIGIGGFQDAYFTGSDSLDQNIPTTTDNSFVLLELGLTYLVLEELGYVSQSVLDGWKTKLELCGTYIENRGYNAIDYYNTENDNKLRACALEILFKITGNFKYRVWARNQAQAALYSLPTFQHFRMLKGAWEDDRSNDESIIAGLRGYLDEDESTTTLSGALTADATTVTVASLSSLGLSAHTSNMVVVVDSEAILLGLWNSGNIYTNCTRGYLGSTATTHSNGATVRRGLDFGYMRVQAPANYLYGLLSGDYSYCTLAKIIWNCAEDRIDTETLDMDISGGSRNATVVEGYATNMMGINMMSLVTGEPYPSESVCADMLSALGTLVSQYGFIPADTASLTASNLKQTSAYSSFALGWANCLLYLEYAHIPEAALPVAHTLLPRRRIVE